MSTKLKPAIKTAIKHTVNKNKIPVSAARSSLKIKSGKISLNRNEVNDDVEDVDNDRDGHDELDLDHTSGDSVREKDNMDDFPIVVNSNNTDEDDIEVEFSEDEENNTDDRTDDHADDNVDDTLENATDSDMDVDDQTYNRVDDRTDNRVNRSKPTKNTVTSKQKIVAPEPMPKMTIPNTKKDDNLQELDKVMLDSMREDEEEQRTTIVIPKKIVTKTRAKAIKDVADKQDLNDDGSIPTANKKPRKKSTSTKGPATKKGPGRPRKTPKKEPIARKGISKVPSNADDHIEFLYDQPVLLKKIFQFFKSLAAAQIQVMFRPKDIVFYAEDHHKKSKIYVKIDASKINHYYCKSTLDIGISSKEMELILNKVDKEYNNIIILSLIGSTQRNITLILENDIQIDEVHTIDLIGQYNKMENEEDFIDEGHVIKFQLPSKYFKKTIGDIKTMSSQLSITQEDNESPLLFEYLTHNKKIQSKHTVKDSNKIKLSSNLEAGESFRVDVKIDYIKPISAAQIADSVMILTDENKAFMTKAYIDNQTIEIKTLTEIIDDRPEDEEIED